MFIFRTYCKNNNILHNFTFLSMCFYYFLNYFKVLILLQRLFKIPKLNRKVSNEYDQMFACDIVIIYDIVF